MIIKKALNFVTDFENAVANEAMKRGYQGVVCGHIHRAEIRMINGILYCNDGDWVESCTALVEHFDGTFEIITWNDIKEELNEKNIICFMIGIQSQPKLLMKSIGILNNLIPQEHTFESFKDCRSWIIKENIFDTSEV